MKWIFLQKRFLCKDVILIFFYILKMYIFHTIDAQSIALERTNGLHNGFKKKDFQNINPSILDNIDQITDAIEDKI